MHLAYPVCRVYRDLQSLIDRSGAHHFMDNLMVDERSALMARISSTGTHPELAVRKLAHRLGFRFRLHRRDLPGTPDLVFPRLRRVVFVHGCFWHAHECRRSHVPASRQDYWLPKLARNAARDARAKAALIEGGWDVLTVWECECRDLGTLADRLTVFLDLAFISSGTLAR